MMDYARKLIFSLVIIALFICIEETRGSAASHHNGPGGRRVLVRKTKLNVQIPIDDNNNDTTSDGQSGEERENSKFVIGGKPLLHHNMKEDSLISEFDPTLLNYNFGDLSKNHIRIERQSESDQNSENQVIPTTESLFNDETTIYPMDLHFSENITQNSQNEPTNSKGEDETAQNSKPTENSLIYDEQPEEQAIAETTTIPILSISKLLSKLNRKDQADKDSLSDILPTAITGTRFETEIFDEISNSGTPEEPEFVSYDVNVGTSLVAGDQDSVGVGQVFPVDINHAPAFPPSRSPEKEQPNDTISFLDSFLNLFAAGAPKITKEENSQPKNPTGLLPPPRFNSRPPPPPSLVVKPSSSHQTLGGKANNNNLGKFENNFELDLEAKPTIENEVRTRPKPGSVTRNELPIRRRPTSGGPIRPGLLASRHNFPFSKRPGLANVRTSEELLPELPSEPVIEGGFEAIKPVSNETEDDGNINAENAPTLPPSLPNLQIIPFVAADAVVNQGEPLEIDESGFVPKPFGSPASQDCREGGKLWENGEVVAQRDDDPCVLCRCLQGKVICQRQECPTLPDGCTSDELPAEGECCPKITCDEAANVSIIDTLPIFRPISMEEDTSSPTPSENPSRPIRPSPFAHLNRRPPFSSLNRPQNSSKPVTAARKPTLLLRRRPLAGKQPEAPTKLEATTNKPEAKERPSLRRPIRPVVAKSPTRKIPKPSPESSEESNVSRLRPYSSLIRTGTRPPFIPPRRPRPTTEKTQPIKISTPQTSSEDTTYSTETATTTSTTTTTAATTTTTATPTTTQSPLLLLTTKEHLLPIETHFETETSFEEKVTEVPKQPESSFFENLFAGLSPDESPLLPSPIHSQPTPDEASVFSESDKTFSLPPDLLLPEPLISSSVDLEDDDIINFVQQDKFLTREVESLPHTAFEHHQPSKHSFPSPKPAFRPLPEIPESVKAQLPLGNDPILVSGLLELAGCNVYGRMFEVGEEISDISGRCKACQCTKVGVQCLPIC